MSESHGEGRGTAVAVPTPGYVLEELDGKLMLFDPASGRIVQANATAALVWGLCDGSRTLGEITELLAAYLGQEAGVRADVPRIVRELLESGALRTAGSG